MIEKVLYALKAIEELLYQLQTDMPQSPRSFTVGDTPPITAVVEAPVIGIRKVRIFNTDPVKTVYVGTHAVSTETGFPIPPAGKEELTLIPHQPSLYGITSGGSAEIRIWEM